MTVHSPTVRDIKTRGTVGNTVVHMHPVLDNPNMLFALFRVQNLSTKDIAGSDIMKMKVS